MHILKYMAQRHACMQCNLALEKDGGGGGGSVANLDMSTSAPLPAAERSLLSPHRSRSASQLASASPESERHDEHDDERHEPGHELEVVEELQAEIARLRATLDKVNTFSRQPLRSFLPLAPLGIAETALPGWHVCDRALRALDDLYVQKPRHKTVLRSNFVERSGCDASKQQSRAIPALLAARAKALFPELPAMLASDPLMVLLLLEAPGLSCVHCCRCRCRYCCWPWLSLLLLLPTAAAGGPLQLEGHHRCYSYQQSQHGSIYTSCARRYFSVGSAAHSCRP